MHPDPNYRIATAKIAEFHGAAGKRRFRAEPSHRRYFGGGRQTHEQQVRR